MTFLGLVTGTLGKIATDVMLMMATEFGEVAEPFVQGRGASSTMPQKRNPISCELMLAAAKAVRQHVALMLDGMVQDFERATGPWHVEWIAHAREFHPDRRRAARRPSSCSAAWSSMASACATISRSRGGLIVAEAVMMAAAPKLGRQRAHDVVYDACRSAGSSKRPLADMLVELPEIVDALGGAEAIRHHCDPANYLGLAPAMVDHMLGQIPRR